MDENKLVKVQGCSNKKNARREYKSLDEPRLAPSEVDSILPSVQVKKMFVEKKVTSS